MDNQTDRADRETDRETVRVDMQDNTRGDPNNKKLNANSICVSRLNGQWSFESLSP